MCLVVGFGVWLLVMLLLISVLQALDNVCCPLLNGVHCCSNLVRIVVLLIAKKTGPSWPGYIAEEDPECLTLLPPPPGLQAHTSLPGLQGDGD